MRAHLDLPVCLEAARNAIEGSLAPAIVLSPAEDARVTRSRFGGAPLLAPGTVWPRSDRGPLSFVGQLDFRELRGFGGDGLVLPSDGILAFFYDVEEQPWGYDPAHSSGWALAYAPESASAVDVEAPLGAIPFNEEPLAPTSTLSLPWPGDLSLTGRLEGPEQAQAYRDFVESFTASSQPAFAFGPHRQQVGGHPQWLDGDGRVTAELASTGIHAKDRAGLRSSDRHRAESSAGDWRLLWQLEPQDDRFTWVELGTLYVLIRDDDLTRRRFDRAWVIFQAG